MKRSTIVSIFVIALLAFLIVLPAVNGKVLVPLILIFVTVVGVVIGMSLEWTKISKKITMYYDKSDTDGLIKYLNNQIYKAHIMRNSNLCVINLVFAYMFIGDTEKTKEVLEKHKARFIHTFPNLQYIKLILAVNDNNLDEAKLINQKIQKSKYNFMHKQKLAATQLFEMVEIKKFNKELYESTKYPLVKEICMRYK